MTTAATALRTMVLHAHWSEGALRIWGESAARWSELSSTAETPTAPSGEPAGEPAPHPFAAEPDELLSCLARALGIPVESISGDDSAFSSASVVLLLPEFAHRPSPSPRLAHAVGHQAEENDTDLGLNLVKAVAPCVVVEPLMVGMLLDALEELSHRDTESAGDDSGEEDEAPIEPSAEQGDTDGQRVILSESVLFFAAIARFVRHLLAQQRFVPMVMQDVNGGLRAGWQVWLADDATSKKLSALSTNMPGSARAAVDSYRHDGWTMLEACLHGLCDAAARRVFQHETMGDAIEGRDPTTDAHVAWLSGLLNLEENIETTSKTKAELVKGARRWIGGLDDRGVGSSWRLLLKLSEPLDLAGISDTGAPGDGVRWTMSLLLQNVLKPHIKLEADDLWVLPGGGTGAANVEGERIEAPGEVLLAELGRAARLWKRLESVLNDPEPRELELGTSDAYKFLREIKPILIEQGFGVEAPDWWDQPTIRLGARMIVESEDVDLSGWVAGRSGAGGSGPTSIGLSSLVNYRWQIAVGDTTLTLEQFERLAAQHSPLIRLNGKWVEIRPEDVKSAMRFIRENPGGEMEVGKALRLAYASDPEETGLPILGMEATGWVATVFGDASTNLKLPMLEAPRGFIGTLRPYQLKGLSWLAFLDRFGLGTCLADDMGLGKTIQLLALLAHESQMRQEARRLARERAGISPDAPEENVIPEAIDGPTLLVVPMSVVPNWLNEARRFTPDLRVLVHHGPTRPSGQALFDAAISNDVLVTTYALAHRDREDLAKIPWGRIVLDEAQNVKNPGAKQTRAIREIDAPRKIALTGTPVENRLGELWSIMDFLNPGYLGSGGEFRRKFSVPIERFHDRHKSLQLRGLVQPFVLRRLKSDPTVISDLPEKVESKEYCYLTPEQATLYQNCVNDMLSVAEKSTGMQRRGVVLAGLIKLKQICNHPAQFLKEYAASAKDEGDETEFPSGQVVVASSAVPSAARSGKCHRIVEMLDEVVAAGDKALVFTQFRQMGFILAAILRKALDREVLFLHGGTATGERQRLINEFQGERSNAAPGSIRKGSGNAPIFILSLKAGGVGLNLTAANHVFHFDRWWNPAVEAQATDRAYRIGQTRTVQVHKFVTAGSLEERIDQMIEAKTELAQEVIGSGEDWLTELNTSQLRDLLMLRTDSVGEVDA